MKHKVTLICCLFCIVSLAVRADLPVEPVGQVKKLPQPYPKHWVLIHDAAFHHMMSGKIILLDADADILTQYYKGMIDSSFMSSFIEAESRPEMYVAESFYSRGSRGKRTDVVTIYDKANLKIIDEVVLPGGKRSTTMPEKFALQLINNEKLLLVFNMTVATSVTVVDIINRKVLNEIPIPSCALIYPTGQQGFSSFCANASMLSFQLNEKGEIKQQYRVEPFFNIDTDALFEKPAIINGIGYFPTFTGNVKTIDFRGNKPEPGDSWSLVTEKERSENWRPGGWQLIGSDAMSRMYLLMHKDGREGSHKDAGSEVWVFDINRQKRVQRVPLKNRGISIELTRDANPLLLVVNTDMNIDVYDAKNGSYLRSLSNFGQEVVFVMHAVR